MMSENEFDLLINTSVSEIVKHVVLDAKDPLVLKMISEAGLKEKSTELITLLTSLTGEAGYLGVREGFRIAMKMQQEAREAKSAATH